jgi:hypothetical protein
MTQPICDLCGRPLPDQGYVCSKCAEVVGVDLARIVDLAPEVETTVAKLARVGTQLGGGSKERPLPFDAQAADRADALKNTLSTWARHVAESIGVQIPPKQPGELGAQLAARFLGERLNWIRHHQEAAECFGDLSRVARQLEAIVGRPPNLRYRGPCWADLGDVDEVGDPLLCQEILYIRPGAAVAKCRECGAEYDAADRREWLLKEARSTLAHAALIASSLTALDMAVAVGTIYSWANRGRIVDHGTDQFGRPLYRVGDAIDLLTEQRQRAGRVA